jgi:hypothetical protein
MRAQPVILSSSIIRSKTQVYNTKNDEDDKFPNKNDEKTKSISRFIIASALRPNGPGARQSDDAGRLRQLPQD